MLDVILFQLLAQTTTPMTPYEFALALSDRWLPFLMLLAGILATWLKTREAVRKVDENTGVTEKLAADVNGRMDQLQEASERAARAEGKLEAAEGAGPPALPIVNITAVIPAVPPGPSVPGGRRSDDHPPPAEP